MTVKELINELQKMPQDKEVYIDDSSLISWEPNHIYLHKPVYSIEPWIEGEEPIVTISHLFKEK